MKKDINIVFFANVKNIVWDEETNLKLGKILDKLELQEKGKNLSHEIEIKINGVQEMKSNTTPIYSDKKNKKELNFLQDRMSFKFEPEAVEVSDEIKKYFIQLEEIRKILDLEITRIGISYFRNIDTEINLSNHYLPLYNTEDVAEFGIKQNKIEKIYENTEEVFEMNFLTMLEVRRKKPLYLIDINTIPKGNTLEIDLRELFLEKVIENMDIFIQNIENLIKEGKQ